MARELADMPVDECRDVLGKSRWGRLQVQVDGHQTTVAVQHLFDRPTTSVVVPMTDDIEWRDSAHDPVVFEVDWIEPAEGGRCTVTVVGAAEEVTDPAETARLAATRPSAWTPTENVRWLRIREGRTAGRHRHGAPYAHSRPRVFRRLIPGLGHGRHVSPASAVHAAFPRSSPRRRFLHRLFHRT